MKEGDENVLFNYKIKVIKLNKTLPESVEIQWVGKEVVA
jgi:hypothetical protein